MGWRRGRACERASEWISLELDGELGRLERSALHRHLERCEGCRTTNATLDSVTQAIRAEPQIEP